MRERKHEWSLAVQGCRNRDQAVLRQVDRTLAGRTRSHGATRLGTGECRPVQSRRFRPHDFQARGMIMKSARTTITAIALACALALPAFAATDTPQAVAARLLDRLDAGQYDQAEALFDANMQLHVPVDKLKSVWTSLPPAGERGTPRQFQQNDNQIVQQTLRRGATSWTVTVAVDAQGKVSGFFVQPLAQAAPIAPVAADASYTERGITVGASGHPLGGTLAMPKGKGPFAAVVLVHGSGPQDRDETIGPNHVFTDIAHGLAAQGIAVLRYDKRTQARPADFASGDITIDSETTDDAVAAAKALATTAGIDPKRIFV